ncbi:MAG: hypothetical protein IJT87_06685 [Ruminiclostridium sp.]|jgi:hypothetical protein|nr:hypothetical protein [Ruminiclostridium sp.]
MFVLGDKVKIKDNDLIGEICDICDDYCYVDVNPDKMNGIKPDFMDRLFERKLEGIEKIA